MRNQIIVSIEYSNFVMEVQFRNFFLNFQVFIVEPRPVFSNNAETQNPRILAKFFFSLNNNLQLQAEIVITA